MVTPAPPELGSGAPVPASPRPVPTCGHSGLIGICYSSVRSAACSRGTWASGRWQPADRVVRRGGLWAPGWAGAPGVWSLPRLAASWL